MRSEIPTWVALVVIVVIVVLAGFLLWRGTGVQKVQESPEQLPGAMMGKYGAPGVIAPRQPGAGGQQASPGGQSR